MKPASHTIISSIAATSTMTLFSYIVSDHEDENFREPELLANVIKKSFDAGQELSPPLGWVSHYLIGVGFAGGYKLLLRFAGARPSAKNGLLFGAFAGGAGVLWWKMLFEKHHNPPKTDRKGFYAQLIIAHLIFGLTLSAFKNRQMKDTGL